MCVVETKALLEQWGKWVRDGGSYGCGYSKSFSFAVPGRSTAFISDEIAGIIDQCVNVLRSENPLLGEIVYDYHYHNMDFREIATDCGIGVSTCKARYDQGVGFIDGLRTAEEKRLRVRTGTV